MMEREANSVSYMMAWQPASSRAMLSSLMVSAMFLSAGLIFSGQIIRST